MKPERTTQQRVEFTQRQLDWLDKQFPEIVGTASTSTEELRWRSAQRSVIAFLNGRVATPIAGD